MENLDRGKSSRTVALDIFLAVSPSLINEEFLVSKLNLNIKVKYKHTRLTALTFQALRHIHILFSLFSLLYNKKV